MSVDPVSIGIQLALVGANMALTMTRHIDGPRLDDLKVTMGDYNTPIPKVWGKRRVQGQMIWAEDLREQKVESKTKGGKYNDYRYDGDWAVAFADGEQAGVTRIWFDTHLVLDLTGAGPISPFDFSEETQGGKGGGGAGAGAFAINDHIAIYLGTETQEPDEYMAAAIEARHGAGSVTAHRGLAYAVFKGVPLGKVGNRIPQVTIETVSVKTEHMPSENFTPSVAPGYNKWRISADGSRIAWINGAAWIVCDVAARAEMISGTLPFDTVGSGAMGVFNDGRMLYADLFGGDLYTMSPDGANALMFNASAATNGQSGGWVVADGNGTEHWGGYPSSFHTESVFDGTMIDFGWQVRHAFADGDGNVWLCGNSGATLHFRRMTTLATGLPDAFSVTMPGDPGGNVYAVGGEAAFLTYWNGTLYLVDPVTATRTTAATVPGASQPGVASAFANVRTGARSIWLVAGEYSIETGQLLRTAPLPADPGIRRAVYDGIGHALWTNDNGITIYYLDRLDGAAVTLGDVANQLAAEVGADDADFSALDQEIEGTSATQGAARAILEPLFDAHDCDPVPHGFGLIGRKRGGATAGTLPTRYFAKRSPRYDARERTGAELPRALTYAFADSLADQQPNNVRSDRPLDATGARGEKAVDLSTYVGTPATMRGLADRHFRRLWNERREAELALTFQQLALEPADLRVLELDGEEWPARLVRMTIKADRTIATEWRYDHPSLAALSGAAGAGMDGRPPSAVVVPLPSKGFVLDLPLLSDSDNSVNPLLYTAGAPYAAGAWPGATIWRQVGSEYSDPFDTVPSGEQATWGYATGVLPAALATVWDRASVVNVKLQSGTLTGCTEADIDANPARNLLLIGAEIVNFTVATLQGDGSHNVSGFKRGRRGTEWAIAGHAARDVVLLLNMADAVEAGLSDVGTDLSFKAATAGRSIGGAFPIDVDFTGASLKPYSPVHLRAAQSGSDWVLDWVRRTRVGGAWTNGSDASLGESSELYTVEILDGAAIKRTITGLTTPSATYTAAQQTADWGAPLTSAPAWRVRQVGAIDGYAATYA